MLLIRSAKPEDIDALLSLSAQVGGGMTTMPYDKRVWEDKLARSTASFSQANKQENKGTDVYFLVMEDTCANQIVGTAAIYTGIGITQPFYSYKLSTQTQAAQQLGITVHVRVLHLVNDYTGGTELGSLFLLPNYRKNGNGHFLSRSRQMLLADFPDRFTSPVFAELRGWLRKDGSSPFWDHLGYKFFNLPYDKADFISAVDGYQFISDLMPKHPVYLDLLPEEAQNVVGKTHDDGHPARKLLEHEGFQYSGYIDIFDAGPCVQSQLNHIYTVQHSHKARFKLPNNDNDRATEWIPEAIISNCTLQDYRLILAGLHVLDDGSVVLDEESAQALHVSPNDSIRYISTGYPQ